MAVLSVTMPYSVLFGSDHIGPGNRVCIDAVGGRLVGLRQTLGPSKGFSTLIAWL